MGYWRRIPVILLATVLVLALAGCVAVQPVANPVGVATVEATATNVAQGGATTAVDPASQPVDYSDPQRWLSLPVTGTKPVDVFYLYPTVFQKADASAPNIATIDDPGMLKNAKVAYARQATAFEPTANVYAPYYRQADAVYTLNLPPAQQAQVVSSTPLTDATAAFQYYLDHYNNGRPFILAAHSQGSNVLIFLLSDYMKAHPEVYERMIAAYVVGYSITPDYLAQNPHLKFAEGADDTGVIVSYNTEAPVVGGPNPVVLPGALAINPITWTRTEELAPADLNLGSISLNKDGTPVLGPDGTPAKVMNFADARVDTARGVVVTSTPPVDKLAPGNALFPSGVYHTFDYPFYYFDIEENAAVRAEEFLKNWP